MRAKIAKWGNSLGLRIPRSLAESIRVSDGTTVELRLENGELVIRNVHEKKYTLDGLLEGVTESNLHGETDFGDAVGREAW